MRSCWAALRSLFKSIGLGWADKLLGAVFGLLRGAVIVTIGVMGILALSPPREDGYRIELVPYFLNAHIGRQP